MIYKKILFNKLYNLYIEKKMRRKYEKNLFIKKLKKS